MEFPGDVFPIFQKKLVIMCILRQKKLQLPQRDSPGLEVETTSSSSSSSNAHVAALGQRNSLLSRGGFPLPM